MEWYFFWLFFCHMAIKNEILLHLCVNRFSRWQNMTYPNTKIYRAYIFFFMFNNIKCLLKKFSISWIIKKLIKSTNLTEKIKVKKVITIKKNTKENMTRRKDTRKDIMKMKAIIRKVKKVKRVKKDTNTTKKVVSKKAIPQKGTMLSIN